MVAAIALMSAREEREGERRPSEKERERGGEGERGREAERGK